MKILIEKPKVFISYAWGSYEHNNKVLLLATNLKNDGVEVIFDKWQLKEGFDTFAFMEKSVTDISVTNVLILIDPIYTQKADSRSGGVGTETQIISPEIYNKIDQNKFIPIIIAKDEKGDISKPNFLKRLLHFDLSNEDDFDLEYQRLVRRLFGIETVKEPELGNPPAWLTIEPKVLLKSQISNEFYIGNSSDLVKKKKLDESLSATNIQLIDYRLENSKNNIESYLELIPLRNDFLLHMRNSDFIIDGYKSVIVSLEYLADKISQEHEKDNELKKTLIHELFIYLISYYFKCNNHDALKYILNKTYFISKSNFNEDEDSFNSFYFNNRRLDDEVRKRDQKNYYSGTATLWLELINIEICNKDEFVFADLFCFSSSYLIENYKSTWAWFPITYVYSNEYKSLLKKYSIRLKSKEHLERAANIMGYNTVEDFIKEYSIIEGDYKKGELKDYRYSNCFDSAETFWEYISSKELGTKN